MSDDVRLEVADRIATLTIDRPAVRNAIDRATAEAIAAALDEVDARDDVTVAILTGAGGGFSAGMDLKAYAATGDRPISETRGGFGIVERPPEKPILAAVEGACLGGGFEIALACDVIVAADDAKLGLPEVKRGLVATAGGVLRLPRRLPRNVAMELVITGDLISARRAHDLGLVAEVVTPGTALQAAMALARRVAVNAPLAVRTAKRLVVASPNWPEDEAFARQAPIAQPVRDSRDALEGARAFVEKRAPVWQGR